MNRRQFSGWVLAAMGGVVHSRALAAILDQDTSYIFSRKAYIAQSIDAFSQEKRSFVGAIADAIIPRTDTPGAVDAGVPTFVELIYANWMNDAEREAFDRGLNAVEQLSQERTGTAFVNSTTEQKISVLETIEELVDEHPWYELGAESGFDIEAPFIAIIKELTIFGFFMSEVGATQVLRMNHVPGYFQGDIPLGRDESSWTPVPLM